jgi:hypothetical protein
VLLPLTGMLAFRVTDVMIDRGLEIVWEEISKELCRSGWPEPCVFKAHNREEGRGRRQTF